MAIGRPLAPIVLEPHVREELESLARSRSLSHSLVRRAQIALMAADGLTITEIAEENGAFA